MQTSLNNIAYRSASGITLVTLFILIWLSMGVGIIGKDGDPANVMYFSVLAVGVIGAFMSRLQPNGMVRTLILMALAQMLITLIALVARLGLPWSGPVEIILLNGFFISLFLVSAWLFWRAAKASVQSND